MQAAVILASCVFAGEGQRALPPKQFVLEVGIYSGDPLGNRESGTLRTVLESKTYIESGRQASLVAGNQIAIPAAVTWKAGNPKVVPKNWVVGTSAELIVIGFGNGKVYLDANVCTRSINPGRGVKTEIGLIPGFDEASVRSSHVADPGKPVTFRISASSPTDQSWATVKVTPVK